MLSDIFAGALGSDKAPWDDYWYEPIGARTHAGINVTPESAMRFATVFACIQKISKTISSLPMRVHERTGPRTRTPVDHPLNDILSWKGDKRATGVTVRSSMSSNRLGWGNGVAAITRTNGGEVDALTPLMSRDLRPRLSSTGELLWDHFPNGQFDTTLSPGEYLHDPGPFVINGILGETPIKVKETIAGGVAAETFTHTFFGNGASPGGFLEFPSDLDLSEERQDSLVQKFNEIWQGAGKAHKVGRLREGVKFNQLDMNLDDMQLIELRKFDRIQICSIFDVPPPMIQELDPGKYTAIEQAMIAWVRDSLLPICIATEAAYKRTFFADSNLYVKHNLAGLARGDMKARSDFYSKGIQNGWFTVDDVREMEDLNPVDGGDRNWIQQNMMPLDSPGTIVPGAPPPSNQNDDESRRAQQPIIVNVLPQSQEVDAESIGRQVLKAISGTMPRTNVDVAAVFSPLFSDVAARVVAKEDRAVKNAIKRHQADTEAYTVWCDKFFTEHVEYTRKAIEPIVCGLEQVTSETASERPADFAGRYADHQQQVARGVPAGGEAMDAEYLLSELKTTYLTESIPCQAN